jgi:hypothetical protein
MKYMRGTCKTLVLQAILLCLVSLAGCVSYNHKAANIEPDFELLASYTNGQSTAEELKLGWELDRPYREAYNKKHGKALAKQANKTIAVIGK